MTEEEHFGQTLTIRMIANLPNNLSLLVYCAINPFTIIVIPVEAGIQKNRAWMPHQVRHDMPTKSKEALDAQY